MAGKRRDRSIEQTIRWLSIATILGAFIFVVVGDRIGPALFERWGVISDMGLIAILAAVVSLVLGEGVGFFRRNGDDDA